MLYMPCYTLHQELGVLSCRIKKIFPMLTMFHGTNNSRYLMFSNMRDKYGVRNVSCDICHGVYRTGNIIC